MARDPGDRDVEIVSTFLFSFLLPSFIFCFGFFSLYACDSIDSLQSYLVARIYSSLIVFYLAL